MARVERGEGTCEGPGDVTACLMCVGVCYLCSSGALLAETNLYVIALLLSFCAKQTFFFFRVVWTRLAGMMNTRGTYLFAHVAGGDT